MEPVHFLDRVELPKAVCSAMAASVGEIERILARDRRAALLRCMQWRHDAAGAASGEFSIEKEEALDAASELLVAADALHREGDHLAAFALEGIQARILDAAIGCGTTELRPA